MLSKKKRLKRSEFNRFFSIGKKKQTPEFLIIHSPHPTFHASVVVSKKVERTAVKRNKLRRRIYDILRRTQQKTEMSGVYIFITKPGVKNLTYEELKKIIIKSIT